MTIVDSTMSVSDKEPSIIVDNKSRIIDIAIYTTKQ